MAGADLITWEVEAREPQTQVLGTHGLAMRAMLPLHVPALGFAHQASVAFAWV